MNVDSIPLSPTPVSPRESRATVALRWLQREFFFTKSSPVLKRPVRCLRRKRRERGTISENATPAAIQAELKLEGFHRSTLARLTIYRARMLEILEEEPRISGSEMAAHLGLCAADGTKLLRQLQFELCDAKADVRLRCERQGNSVRWWLRRARRNRPGNQ